MKAVKRSSNITRSKLGLNHVRSIVENAGSVFIKIDQEDDLGIDGIIELMLGRRPAHRSFAVQIKSGASYYDFQKAELVFPVGGHRDYWLRHPLPVLGIVYVPSLRTAYWFDLKQALRSEATSSTLKLPALRHYEFSERLFETIFAPLHVNGRTNLPLEELSAYATSNRQAEVQFGFHQLFLSHAGERAFWDLLLEHLRQKAFYDLIPLLPFYLAHVPWHGDLGADGGSPVEGQMKADLLREFSSFGRTEILKLLQFIDPENGIVRGSIGQCVEAVISAIDLFPAKLRDVVKDSTVAMQTREFAVFIHAMHEGKASLPLFDVLIKQGSSYALELSRYLSEADGLYPYS
ncbi:MAG: DUF4365 domain-containing protein [Verrucomicrobia bacterium]|nr:DUF4365 domain-containing protein [Verrucomicrobiota bacterium]